MQSRQNTAKPIVIRPSQKQPPSSNIWYKQTAATAVNIQVDSHSCGPLACLHLSFIFRGYLETKNPCNMEVDQWRTSVKSQYQEYVLRGTECLLIKKRQLNSTTIEIQDDEEPVDPVDPVDVLTNASDDVGWCSICITSFNDQTENDRMGLGKPLPCTHQFHVT